MFAASGKTPVIVNSSRDNGVGGYVALEPTEKGNIITFSDTTTADSIFYQPRDFVGYSHVQGVYPRHPDKWTKETLMYAAVSFRKASEGRFDYANKFNRSIAAELQITLPVKDNHDLIKDDIDKIDFDFMTACTCGMQSVRKEQLQNYLNTVGLTDYAFSAEDKKFISAYRENGNSLNHFVSVVYSIPMWEILIYSKNI